MIVFCSVTTKCSAYFLNEYHANECHDALSDDLQNKPGQRSPDWRAPCLPCLQPSLPQVTSITSIPSVFFVFWCAFRKEKKEELNLWSDPLRAAGQVGLLKQTKIFLLHFLPGRNTKAHAPTLTQCTPINA